MKKKQVKNWQICEVCYQLVFALNGNMDHHVCPELMRAKRDAELDMIIDEETRNWDKAISKFWNRSDVKFEQFLLENKDE